MKNFVFLGDSITDANRLWLPEYKGLGNGYVKILAEKCPIPATYAGGIGSLKDLEHFKKISGGKLDFTIGSALDLFGGKIPYEMVTQIC